MKMIELQPFHLKAIESIQEAIARDQKHMVIEMPHGFGKGTVLVKSVEMLNRLKLGKILVVTGFVNIKEQIAQNLSMIYQGLVQADNDGIVVETEQKILGYSDEKISEYQIVIFYDAIMSKDVCEKLYIKDKTVIVFSTINNECSHRFFAPKDIVFSYSYKQAVTDGYITPAMDTRAFEPAVEVFSKQLLEEFGCTQIECCSNSQACSWDLVVNNRNKTIWVECRAYKSQVVSPSAANSLLNSVVAQKIKQQISNDDIILLLVFSKIPSFQKNEIFGRFKIAVWDIENLVFYCKNNANLLKLLSQITYFPIDHIEGKCFESLESMGLSLKFSNEEIIQEVENERNETEELIRCLNKCKMGKEHSKEYEKVCEKILRVLFETNYFNRLTSQHKTKDEHFRMDLIGSLKINQSNEENIHPLWKLMVQHYNSHFVVFEFKNYSKKIDQNLVYITEKYLFDSALRNVAIIISRKGFSKAAKFAAEGCLKEHGKLILDITDSDMEEMLKLRSDKAADYLLGKVEEFLMGISK